MFRGFSQDCRISAQLVQNTGASLCQIFEIHTHWEVRSLIQRVRIQLILIDWRQETPVGLEIILKSGRDDTSRVAKTLVVTMYKDPLYVSKP